jgi:hypothetical protein
LFRNKFFISILGVILAVLIQEYNLATYQKTFPYNNGLISSGDEASYLRPPQNYLEIGEWKDNSKSITSYFLRPPGYGMLFLICKIISPSNPWIVLKLFQIGAFFCSILLFYEILLRLTSSINSTILFTYLFAILPCFSGFIYFTITEGISPFLLLLSCFTWIRLIDNPNKLNAAFYIFSAGFFLLVRPQLLIFVLLFQFLVWYRLKFFYFVITCLLFLPLFIWNLRTIKINGSFPGLHPIYSYTNNGLYRPSHEKLTNLFRIWEHQSDVFHTCVGIVAFDTSELAIHQSLTFVPNKFHFIVKPILKEYQDLWKYHRENYTNLQKIEKSYQKELDFEKKVEKARIVLLEKYPLDYYFVTPFNSFKKLIFSSHLNLKIFQADFRGSILIEILRWMCLLVIISIVLVSIPSMFNIKNKIVFSLGLSIFLYVFYLVFIQRLNEERYLTPIIPIGFILFSYFTSKLKDKFGFLKFNTPFNKTHNQ